MNISEKLKVARKNSGMTQEQVAEKLGISRQTLSNWETGKTYPDIISVIRLSELYELSLDLLLKDEKEEKAMSDYIDYLEESTNTVKSKTNLSKLIILAVYLIVWVFSICVFWFFTAPDAAAVFSLVFLWVLLPVTTFVLSFIIGKRNYWKSNKWYFSVFFGVMYMLAEYSTFSAANMAEFGKVNFPSVSMIVAGAAFSLVGMALGNLVFLAVKKGKKKQKDKSVKTNEN
ncbi:MAG: helix-turn-helix transcriptional regulator [Clostridia bacterium]|nr:helix-turn-helix transcriptional regulator [Clostridia bacterium]